VSDRHQKGASGSSLPPALTERIPRTPDPASQIRLRDKDEGRCIDAFPTDASPSDAWVKSKHVVECGVSGDLIITEFDLAVLVNFTRTASSCFM